MGQYSENGCRLASDAAKKRHNNKPVEYCRKHCFESSCIGCVLSGQPKKEVEEMPRGIKECPGCHEPIPSRAYAGHIATCEKYAIYAGAQETQDLEETPKEQPVLKCEDCGCILEPEDGDEDRKTALCRDCFEKREKEYDLEDQPEPAPVKESAPKKAPDTKTKPKPLFSIEFEDDAGYETVRKACDALVDVGFSCTLNRDGWFDFRR